MSGYLVAQGYRVLREAVEDVTVDNYFEEFVNGEERAWELLKRSVRFRGGNFKVGQT